jgi:hypothetical protein
VTWKNSSVHFPQHIFPASKLSLTADLRSLFAVHSQTLYYKPLTLLRTTFSRQSSPWQKVSTERLMVSPQVCRLASSYSRTSERMEFTTSKEVQVAPTFEDMHLKENLLRGIYAYGYESPSAVQSRAIVQICKGRDTIAQAQSGTGKTATFSISILQVLETTIRETQGIPSALMHEYRR